MGYTARIILFAPREGDVDLLSASLKAAFAGGRIAVSYTHLTLPTILRV